MDSVRLPLLRLLSAVVLWSLPGAWAGNSTPEGCGPAVGSLYYNLCDLNGVWGVVLEAFAAAGAVGSLMLLLVLLASLPFVTDGKRRSSVGLQAGFLVFTLGLFCLAFAFIVGKDFSTCVARRFLFGVLFAGCFSCLLAHAAGLNVLARRDRGPRGWALCLAALALWLVEVIINTEWLTITVARYPLNATGVPAACAIANPDFAMALIYVMVLLLAALVAAAAALAGKGGRCRKEGAFILATGVLSVGIWVAWIVMYVYGNQRHGNASWDDPTLTIALVANAWVFLILYTIPEICTLTEEGAGQPGYGDDLYPSRGVGYETILKEQTSQNMFMENKAFSMDEPSAGQRPVSPYSGYNGQLRSSVYQPTELALISKGVGSGDVSYETVLPRASAPSQAPSGSSTPRADEAAAGQPQGSSGNGLHRKPQW
ncbi:G-protein coupled receptor family C group 5 member C [Megalops cyprinoides]|uniref:G-protein coupled receptor family C group 5 member C n=1 Tax=Megalops cyprinoides TaxID=118141 RepID=UPI001864D9CA|nr:G-protein coupled receptor family C group 5 member C [Megalops cyprinoides]